MPLWCTWCIAYKLCTDTLVQKKWNLGITDTSHHPHSEGKSVVVVILGHPNTQSSIPVRVQHLESKHKITGVDHWPTTIFCGPIDTIYVKA